MFRTIQVRLGRQNGPRMARFFRFLISSRKMSVAVGTDLNATIVYKKTNVRSSLLALFPAAYVIANDDAKNRKQVDPGLWYSTRPSLELESEFYCP